MTRALLALLLLPVVSAAADPHTRKARAALALAFADAAPPSYPELYARAVRENRPLVLWVGQPARPLPGVLAAELDRFPDAAGPCVVVGRPAGDRLRRTDLPGRPTADRVLAALGPPADRSNMH